MDAAQFRQDFPEFDDNIKHPDSAVNLWLNLGAKVLPADRWEDLHDIGMGLYVAHHLSLAATNQAQAMVGGTPGQTRGPLSSKAVDKVSASYDTGAVTLQDGGFFNLTTYGIQLLGMARMVGSGGIQI